MKDFALCGFNKATTSFRVWLEQGALFVERATRRVNYRGPLQLQPTVIHKGSARHYVNR